MRYTNEKFGGNLLYFTSFDGAEPVHAHLSTREVEAGSAKIWIYSDGTAGWDGKPCSVAERHIHEAERWICRNIQTVEERWFKKWGVLNWKEKKVVGVACLVKPRG